MAEINLNPYTAESDAIARRLRMAEALNQQALQPLDLPTQAGVKVSPYAGLAKMLQAGTSAYMAGQGLEDQKALAEKYQGQSQEEGRQFLNAIQGQQAMPERAQQLDPQELQQMADQGSPMPPNMPAQMAVAPDMKRALAIALNAKANPAIQTAGGAMLANLYKPAETAFAKVNPSQYTPESVALFMAGGGRDYGVLREQPKLSFQNTGTAIQGFNQSTGAASGPATSIGVSPNTTATLAQNRILSDRNYYGLSANQQAQLQNEARRLGISAQQLFFDTGLTAGGGAQLPANTAAPLVPAAGVQGAPIPAAAPVIAPAIAPAARPAPAATQAPAAQPQAVATPNDGLTPKARQELLLENAKAVQKKERGMTGFGSFIDEARNILSGREVNAQGVVTKAPLPTGSGAGALQDFAAGIFKQSPEGAAQADQLKVIGGALVMGMPRMEGPQSDRDVALYRENAGQIGDNTLPIARRLKALDIVEKLYRQYDKSSPVAPLPFGSRPANAVRERTQ